MHSALNPPSAFANEAVRFFPDPNRGIECHPSVDLSGVPHTRDLDVLGQPYATVMRAGEFAVAVGLIPRYLQSLRPGDNVLGIAAYPGSGGIQLSLLDLYEGEALKEAFGGDTGYDALENVSHLVVSTNELVTDDQRRYSHAQGVLDQYERLMCQLPIRYQNLMVRQLT